MTKEVKIFLLSLFFCSVMLVGFYYLYHTPFYVLNKTLLEKIGKDRQHVSPYYTDKYVHQIRQTYLELSNQDNLANKIEANQFFLWSLMHPITKSNSWPKIQRLNEQQYEAIFTIDDSSDYDVGYYFSISESGYALFDSISGWEFFLKKNPQVLSSSAFELKSLEE